MYVDCGILKNDIPWIAAKFPYYHGGPMDRKSAGDKGPERETAEVKDDPLKWERVSY